MSLHISKQFVIALSGNLVKLMKGFKTYISLQKGDRSYLREAEQILRQYELDQDGDGFKFYEEQENGTSDQEPNLEPEAGN